MTREEFDALMPGDIIANDRGVSLTVTTSPNPDVGLMTPDGRVYPEIWYSTVCSWYVNKRCILNRRQDVHIYGNR